MDRRQIDDHRVRVGSCDGYLKHDWNTNWDVGWGWVFEAAGFRSWTPGTATDKIPTIHLSSLQYPTVHSWTKCWSHRNVCRSGTPPGGLRTISTLTALICGHMWTVLRWVRFGPQGKSDGYRLSSQCQQVLQKLQDPQTKMNKSLKLLRCVKEMTRWRRKLQNEDNKHLTRLPEELLA